MSSQDIHARSMTTTSMFSVWNQEEVAKLIDMSKCIGCKVCQVVCSERNELRDEVGHSHDTYDNPMDLTTDSWTVMCFTEHENEAGNLEWLIRKDGCMHCAELGCLKARPGLGVIVKYANGIIDFNQDKCTDCGYCTTSYPFDIPRTLQKDHKAYKCSLCSNRVSVGMEPACVKICLTGAIVLGSKENMKEYVAERIVDLKGRGYKNAGLCGPEGAGGTHVMCVLHHADRPSLYVGLADQSSASPLVSLWKGVTKLLVLLAMGATVLAGFFHCMRVGPNRADDEEDHGRAEAPVHQVDPSVCIFDLHERR